VIQHDAETFSNHVACRRSLTAPARITAAMRGSEALALVPSGRA